MFDIIEFYRWIESQKIKTSDVILTDYPEFRVLEGRGDIYRQSPIFWWKTLANRVLYILTRVWVLRTPNASRNNNRNSNFQHFLCKKLKKRRICNKFAVKFSKKNVFFSLHQNAVPGLIIWPWSELYPNARFDKHFVYNKLILLELLHLCISKWSTMCGSKEHSELPYITQWSHYCGGTVHSS